MNMKAGALTTAMLCGAVLLTGGLVMADTFGTGTNQFTIKFVTISGATNPTSGIPAGYGFTFTGVNNAYRMGTYEVTNDQWDKFKTILVVPVTGVPSNAYDQNPFWTGTNVPTNNVSWYEAAQFVNWLNTSTGHQAAYKFTGTQGTGDYTLATWSTAEADNGTNLYRHKDAKYYLPTENEWVKAAYWNGISLQTYATKAGESLTQGEGTFGTGWNYYTTHYATPPLPIITNPFGPWAVGSGSQELNGTYDMMGNLWEWMESPYWSGDYGTASDRGLRGGSYDPGGYYDLASFVRFSNYLDSLGEDFDVGFRVASEVPEPAILSLLSMGGLALLRRRSRR